MAKTPSVVKRLPLNLEGRDFVVGDIHGAYDLVIEAMHRVKFDPLRDRLFSVGDLINRGPKSHWCADFLRQPYTHAVKGNHEQMMLSLYANGAPDEDSLRQICSQNGLEWWIEMPHEKRLDILNQLQALPFAIEVQTRRGLVGLLHADIPKGMSWPAFLANLEVGDRETQKACLWGRLRINEDNKEVVPGVGRVFVGHTIQWNGIKQFGNVYAIDTGAVFSQINRTQEGHLTIANMTLKTSMLLSPEFKAKNHIAVRHDEKHVLDHAFGDYSTPNKASTQSQDNMDSNEAWDVTRPEWCEG